MGSAKNTLDRSDISTSPIKLKYQATYLSASANSYGITVNRGTNTSYDSNSNEFLNYALVKQLYYQEYLTGSLNNSASYWNPSIQSTAASGTFDNDYRYFPTESGKNITILSIPRTVFGENIGKKSLSISGSTYSLFDDGNGNLLDRLNSNSHVGNVLYSQGIIVLTNPDYEYALIQAPVPTTSTTTTTTTPTPTTTTTTSTTTTTTTPGPTTSTTTTTTTPTPTTSTTTTTTTPTPTTTTTSTTTTTTTPCPCVCGVSITNTDSVTISYSYQDCYNITYTGNINVGQTFTVSCPDPAVGNVKNNSVIIGGGTANVVYGSCTDPASTTTSTTTTTTTLAPTTTSTTTTTTTPAPTTTTTTTTTSTTTTTTTGIENIIVSAKIVGFNPANIQYSINGGSPIFLGGVESSTCTQIGTIVGVGIGSTVTFTDPDGRSIGGSETNCPDTTAGCTYQITVNNATMYVYLSVSDDFC